MDPVDSDPLSRVGPYSGAGRETPLFGLGDYHTLWSTFPGCLAKGKFADSHTPGPSTPPGRVQEVWAVPLSLAATDGVAFAFFS